jgi:hypothetical protein
MKQAQLLFSVQHLFWYFSQHPNASVIPFSLLNPNLSSPNTTSICSTVSNSLSPFAVVVKDKDESRKSRYMWSAVGDTILNAKNVRLVGIHRHIVEVYRESAMNEGNVRKGCRLFKEGRTNMYDEKRSRRAKSSIGKFWSTLLHTVPILHLDFIICFSTSRRLWPAKFWETKDVGQDWLNVLTATFFDEGIQNWSHDITSTFIYMATIWRSSLI